MPVTETAQREIPEQVITHHPSKLIQPTAKAANLLCLVGARMKVKWYCPCSDTNQSPNSREGMSLPQQMGTLKQLLRVPT